jgi:hypothetical protein
MTITQQIRTLAESKPYTSITGLLSAAADAVEEGSYGLAGWRLFNAAYFLDKNNNDHAWFANHYIRQLYLIAYELKKGE